MEDKNLHILEEFENVAYTELEKNPEGLRNVTKETVEAVENRYNEKPKLYPESKINQDGNIER